MLIILILFLFLSIIFFTGNAFAYIDPGTGAFIIQAIIAFFATIVLYITWPFKYIKKMITTLFKKNKESKDDFKKEK